MRVDVFGAGAIGGLVGARLFEAGVDVTLVARRAHAEALRGATFESVARADIMRWKYRKLIMNLANAVEALTGRPGRDSAVARAAQSEGEAVPGKVSPRAAPCAPPRPGWGQQGPRRRS
jgi:ketopantoate reductase